MEDDLPKARNRQAVWEGGEGVGEKEKGLAAESDSKPSIFEQCRRILEEQRIKIHEEEEQERKRRRVKLWILGLTAVPTFCGIGIYAVWVTLGALPIVVLISFVLSLYWLKLLLDDQYL